MLLIAVSAVVGVFTILAAFHRASASVGSFLQERHYLFSITWAVVGAIWALLGIISLLKQNDSSRTAPRLHKRALVDISRFVNRVDDLNALIVLASKHTLISVFGQKGVGKSELLKVFCDLLNVRKKDRIHFPVQFPNQDEDITPKAAFYVDLVDKVGSDRVLNQMATSICGTSLDSIQDLAAHVDSRYRKKPILIILDNVNNIATSHQIIQSITQYQLERPKDVVILGSIHRLTNPHVNCCPHEVHPFPESHCRLFLEKRGLQIGESEIARYVAKTYGLPLYLNLVALNDALITGESDDSFSGYFLSQIYNQLPDGDQELFLFICLCNLTVTTISKRDLRGSALPRIDSGLKRLAQFSTIIETRVGDAAEIKVHDLLRDICLEFERENLSQSAVAAANFIGEIDELAAAPLWALCSQQRVPANLALEQKVAVEISNNNFAFLLSFWEIAENWAAEDSAIHKDENLYDVAIYGNIVALLGIGHYKKAEEIVKSSATHRLRATRIDRLQTRLEFDFHFSRCDLDHLLNRYELAREQVQLLTTRAAELNWIDRFAESLWLDAHLTGHIGDDLNHGIALYQRCADVADESGNDLLNLRARNGMFALSLASGGSDNVSERAIYDCIDRCRDVAGSAPVESALYRNLARLYRVQGRLDSATDAIDKASDIASEHNLRTIINCEFSRGETSRFACDFEAAVQHYREVMAATQKNGDVNLYTSALLAMCICEIQNQQLLYHSSIAEVGDSINHVAKASDRHKMLTSKARSSVVEVFWRWTSEQEDHLDFTESIEALRQLGLTRDLEVVTRDDPELNKLEIHIH